MFFFKCSAKNSVQSLNLLQKRTNPSCVSRFRSTLPKITLRC